MASATKRRRPKSGYSKRSSKRVRLAATDRLALVNTRLPLYRTPTNARGPLPVKCRATFVYSNYATLDPAAGDAATLDIAANDCTTLQPRGFDQMMTLYDHYVVIGARLEVWFTNNSAQAQMMAGVVLRDVGTAITSAKTIQESAYIKQVCISMNDAGSNTGYVNVKLNPNKWLGRSKPLADPQLKGSTGASPQELVHFIVFAHAMNLGGTGVVAGRLRYRLTQEVVLIEPKQPAAS